METTDISWLNLLTALLFLIPVFLIANRLRLGVNKAMFIALSRMLVQLYLVGFYLEYLFLWNNLWINVSYFIVMIFVASYTISQSGMALTKVLIRPVFTAIFISFGFFVLLFNLNLLGPKLLFDARYLIPIGGMLLGNSLKTNLIALNTFLRSVKENETQYQQHIGFGASQAEACRPFVQDALRASLNPTIAMVATIGLVSLPGMMTGQLLGGSSPLVAIKYQIAIVLGILASSFFSVVLQSYLLQRTVFDSNGILRHELLTRAKGKNKHK